MCRSAEDGRWQWSYSSWDDTGTTADLEESYRLDLGYGDHHWPTSGLCALLHRIRNDVGNLMDPERF